MDSILSHGLIGSSLKHINVSSTTNYDVAPCLPAGTVEVVGYVVAHSLLLSALGEDSKPKTTLTLAFEDDIRTFSVHSSARFVAVTLESKKLYILNLVDQDKTGAASPDRISGFKILYSLTAPKKVTTLQWIDDATLLYADKFGNIFSHSFTGTEFKPRTAEPTVPLGHYSVVTDVVMINNADNQRYIAIGDRDEKISVSRWPHAYDIQSYCLGHTQYVTSLCHVFNSAKGLNFLASTGGDGMLFAWDFHNGKTLAKFSLTSSFQPTASYTDLKNIRGSINTTPAQIVYSAQHNLIFISIEFLSALLIFEPSSSESGIQFQLITQQSLDLIPMRTSVDKHGRLWVSGVPCGENNSNTVLVFDIVASALQLNKVLTNELHTGASQTPLTLEAEKAVRSFTVHSVEENLRKMQSKRGGVAHAGSYKDEPPKKVTKVN